MHDVFISHANADKAVADMVCATLEQQGLRCWIAPRDIEPGADWGGAIVGAIRRSRAMGSGERADRTRCEAHPRGRQRWTQ